MHGVFNDRSIDSFVLTTKAFPERHTAMEITQKLKETTGEFGIKDKIVAVVHDQAANMECCCSLLSEEEGLASIKCTAHCLRLCLQSGFDRPVFSRLLGTARKLVGHFNHSVVASEELKRRCVQMKTEQKKVVRDCATRWNSSFYMLDRLLQLRWPITAVLSDEDVTKHADRYLDLKSDQWFLAADLTKILHPFEVATKCFSYETNIQSLLSFY